MIRARRARCGAVRDRCANESSMHAFVVRQNQRNLWASQCHARLLVDEYALGRAIYFTFFAVRRLATFSRFVPLCRFLNQPLVARAKIDPAHFISASDVMTRSMR